LWRVSVGGGGVCGWGGGGLGFWGGGGGGSIPIHSVIFFSPLLTPLTDVHDLVVMVMDIVHSCKFAIPSYYCNTVEDLITCACTLQCKS